MFVLSESASVDCSRPLQPTNKIGDASGEAVPGVKDVRIGSTSNSTEDRSGRDLAEQQVTTMSSGPSRKGSGH
ncbi:hypothetical protein PTKIN_Ptkin08bG0116200 [Pterospermum kingtungense]